MIVEILILGRYPGELRELKITCVTKHGDDYIASGDLELLPYPHARLL